ncbi:MAG: hypothetical protein RDU25_00060 [Patescibacteria group bacterium]|nr:hypothetical protein [Patescibacteria group bacterium]
MHSTATLRTPDVASLEQAPERAVLHVLATASRCARISVMIEFRDHFDASMDDRPPMDPPPHALDLAARQLVSHIDELLASLDLYEVALRDHLRPDLDDLLF